MVVDTRGGNVGMTEPFLHFRNVGLMIERVGRGGRAQRMRADQKPQLPRIAPHQAIDAIGVIAPSSLPVRLLRTGRNSAPLSSRPCPAAGPAFDLLVSASARSLTQPCP